jgi:phage-related protein
MESGPGSKPLFWLADQIKTPPFTTEARREAGTLLRLVQEGESLGMPRSRPMPSIGPRVHELRIVDETRSWRVIYRIDADLILIVMIYEKRTEQTPRRVIDSCRKRLRMFDG